MPFVRVSGPIPAPAGTVWAFAGDFDGLPNWIPGILKSRKEGEGVGQLRHLEIKWKGARWAIEECFELGKGDCGLDEYEVRSWVGWHRHVTLSLFALAVVAVLRSRAVKPPRRKKGEWGWYR